MKRRHDYAQHFLRSPALVKELIGHSNIKKTDTILDIGAGSGIITTALASRVNNVIAVENEPVAAKKLRTNIEGFSNITVFEDDFLAMELPPVPYKVFANIPFQMSADIVRKLTSSESMPSDIYLVVQLQFARKLLIGTDQFTGMLGAQLSPWWATKIRRPLQRTDFWPHPNVDTALVHLEKRNDVLIPMSQRAPFWSFTERCFHDQVYFAKLDIQTRLATKKLRPSELSAAQWVELYSQINHIAKSR